MEKVGKVLISLVLAGMFLAGTAAFAQPNCDQRIRTAEHRLHQAIRRHGANSRQAQKRREHLERVRSHCHM